MARIAGKLDLFARLRRAPWHRTQCGVESREHSLLVGADYSYTHKQFNYGGGTIFPTNVYRPVIDMPMPDMDQGNGNDGRTSEFGLYTRANFQATDHLMFIAGARLGWWKNDARKALAFERRPWIDGLR